MKQEEIDKKLCELVVDGRENWKHRAEERRVKFAWIRRSHAIAMQVMDALKQKSLSQKDLAQRLGVSPQQVNKIVKGGENLTLETIAKLEAALGVELLSISSTKGPASDVTSAVAEEPASYSADDAISGETPTS